MATIKNNWLRAGIAFIVLLFGVFVVVKARETEEETKVSKTRTTVFHYASEDTTPGAFANPNNWEIGPSPSSLACGTGDEKPCELTAADEQDLADILTGNNNLQVLSIADSTRE